MNAQVRVPPAADLAATVASAKVLMGVLTEATINTQLVIYMFSTFTRTMRIHTHCYAACVVDQLIHLSPLPRSWADLCCGPWFETAGGAGHHVHLQPGVQVRPCGQKRSEALHPWLHRPRQWPLHAVHRRKVQGSGGIHALHRLQRRHLLRRCWSY